jgi:hypothetical protein
VNFTIEDYSQLLRETKSRGFDLPNLDFDTGRETRAGEYVLTDKTYAKLVDKLSGKDSNPLSPALREDLLRFYADPNAAVATKKDAKAWRKLQDELTQLRQKPAEQAPAGSSFLER